MFKKKEIIGFYHVPCIFETFERIRDQRNVLTNIDKISGFDKIKESDQLLVLNLIEKINETQRENTRKGTENRNDSVTIKKQLLNQQTKP